MINSLWSLVTGETLERDDPVPKAIHRAIFEMEDLSGSPLFLLAILVPPLYKVTNHDHGSVFLS